MEIVAAVKRCALPHNRQHLLAYCLRLSGEGLNAYAIGQMIQGYPGTQFVVDEILSPSALIISTSEVGFRDTPKVLRDMMPSLFLGRRAISLEQHEVYGTGITEDLVLWVNLNGIYVLASRSKTPVRGLVHELAHAIRTLKVWPDPDSPSRLNLREIGDDVGVTHGLPSRESVIRFASNIKEALPPSWR